jgi:UDP-N-acetylmuramate--alanine ligase
LEFLHHLPFYGVAVLCADDPEIATLLPRVSRPVVTYGTASHCDVRATEIIQSGLKTHFRVRVPDREETIAVTLNLPGKHSVLNALAGIAVALELQIPVEAIQRALENFEGIGRRFQCHGELLTKGRLVTLMDDYGHHPRELAAVLDAIRGGWPHRRLVLAFQPHRYTRTRDLFDDFAHVLSEVDALVLTEIYPAGEKPISGFDGRALSRAVRVRGKVDPVFVERVADLPAMLPDILADGDILLLMGAGDIGAVAARLGQAGFSGERA